MPLILGYAALEGLFVGAVSQFFETMYGGIVAQAVLATLATFAGMFAAYKFGLIKVTDKFRRIVTMMIFGYAIFAVVNFIFAMVTNTAFGFGGSGTVGILISLFAVGLASVSLRDSAGATTSCTSPRCSRTPAKQRQSAEPPGGSACPLPHPTCLLGLFASAEPVVVVRFSVGCR